MELSVQEQIFEQIKKSQKILISLPAQVTANALASALALRLFLTKLEKDVSLAGSGPVPENLKFLPGWEAVRPQLDAGKSLVITVDTRDKELAEVSYQKQDNRVDIYLKAKDRQFTESDLKFAQEKFPLDLIFCLGLKSPEESGLLYEQNTDLFFETPKINIDNQAGNDYFGAVNLVDVTATSVSEILAELFLNYESQVIDQDIATCLLTGIIEKTSSFQHAQTTPKSFLKASELVALGGRQQEIIKNIYKTKPLSLLKLWGRALARMTILEDAKIIYSALAPADFEKAQSSPLDLLPALKEFVDSVSGYRLIALLAQPDKSSAKLLVAIHESLPLEGFLSALGPEAKVLDISFGRHRVVEQDFDGQTLEALQQRFLKSLESGLLISSQ